jgi:hypothetical protein
MIKFEIRKNSHGQKIEEVVHKCTFCGGLIYYNIDAGSATCPYCSKTIFVVKTLTSATERILYHKDSAEKPKKATYTNLIPKEPKPPGLFSLFGWRW